MTVCHLAKFYPPAPGGMETHVQTIARAQVELGMGVRVICVNHRDPHGRDVTWETLTRTRTAEDWDGKVRVTRVGRRASLSRFEWCGGLSRLLGSLARQGVDVLHLHVPNPTMLLALAWSRPCLPLVITYHSDVVRQKALGAAFRPMEHLVFRRAARVLSTSPAYSPGSSLLRRYAAKVRVLPLGVDLGPYLRPNPRAEAHAERLRAEHGRPLWLTVGRLVYYKGLHNAIRALARVPGRLLVIGEGPLEGELRRLADEVGVADRVIWRGSVDADELAGAYHAVTAFWFPSNARSEAFGLVQVEAMASGCPVINTAIPDSGVPWVSPHEETGLTVPVDDPAAFAAAAERLLSEPGLREKLAANGRERAVREFDHRLMAERSAELYREVATARAGH